MKKRVSNRNLSEEDRAFFRQFRFARKYTEKTGKPVYLGGPDVCITTGSVRLEKN